MRDGLASKGFGFHFAMLVGLVAVMDGSEVGPFNLGNPTEFTMLELANLVKEVVNPKAEIIYKENTPDDPSRRKPDITKVQCCKTFPLQGDRNSGKTGIVL